MSGTVYPEETCDGLPGRMHYAPTTVGSRHHDARGRRPVAQRGQAYVIVALGLIAFCGMLALAVDVGTTSARYQAQRHAANTAAYTGAYTLYGGNSGARGLALGANSAVTDTTVLNAIITTLSQGGLSVAKVITTTTSPTPDPCNAGYQ